MFQEYAFILKFFYFKVSVSLSHDLKDLVQEFYKLELVVIVNERNTNDATLNTIPPDPITNKASDQQASTIATMSSPSFSNNNNQTVNSSSTATTSAVDIKSPSGFLHHHANRFKSKLIPQSGLSTTLATPYNATVRPSSTWNTSKNNLIILANAAAIELYFLCVEDEHDAEKLCNKCSEKFFLNLSLTETISQAPLIASCLQVLGRLALKYPNLSKISNRHLTDFLTVPSPILLKQYKHIIEKLNTIKTTNNGVNVGGNKSNATLQTSSSLRYSDRDMKNSYVYFFSNFKAFKRVLYFHGSWSPSFGLFQIEFKFHFSFLTTKSFS